MTSILLGTASLFCFARSYKYHQLQMIAHLATPIDGHPGIKMAQLSPIQSIMGYHDGHDFIKLWSHTYTHDRDGNGAFEHNGRIYLIGGGIFFALASITKN